MAVNLSNLKPARGSRHRKVRVGRGIGSKLGRTAGKGNKGQKSRKGYSRRPVLRAARCRCAAGFRSAASTIRRTVEYAVVNVEMLNGFAAGQTVTPELLIASGLIRQVRAAIKVLGDGELNTALTVRAHKFSKSAEEKITRAGGKVEILP